MAVVPQNKVDLIQFCEAHVPVWQAAVASIGLVPGQVTALDTLTKAARSKFNTAETARAASKAATLNLDDACDALRANVALLVKTIKLYADNQANPDPVYAAAQIPPPAAPTSNPPPGQPNSFTFTIEPGGLLTLRWKSSNSTSSTGANFVVARRIGNQSPTPAPFAVIGGTSSRVFTDDTIPTGASVVTYIVTPKRNGVVGTPSDMISVQFGVGGGLSVTTAANPYPASYGLAA